MKPLRAEISSFTALLASRWVAAVVFFRFRRAKENQWQRILMN
jgi:high-affinity Fe2+/Pb2+ permease